MIEQIPDSLALRVKLFLNNPEDFETIAKEAFERRDAVSLCFLIPEDKSRTGHQIAVIADRAHLTEEIPYRPGERNKWPDVIPPRLNTEPPINGKPQECDYWMLHLEGGRYMTGKLTSQKSWIQVPEQSIEAYKEFSEPADMETIDAYDYREDSWNAFPKHKPSPGTYEVQLKDGRRRVVTWKDDKWTFYGDEIVAFKTIL